MRVPDRESVAALTGQVPVRDALGENGRAALMEWLAAARRQPPDPLLMKVLAGAGAWLASLFIVAFTLTALIVDEQWGAIVSGVVLLVASAPLMRNEQSVFLRQMALAFAMAGDLLVIVGATFLHDGALTDVMLVAAVVQLVVAAVAWFFLDHPAFRFAAALAFFGFATAWLIGKQHAVLIHVLFAAELLAGALWFRAGLSRRFLPLPYAAATAFLVTIAFLELMERTSWLAQEFETFAPMPVAFMLVAAFAALIAWLQGRGQVTRQAGVAGLVVIGVLAWFSTPGVLAALLLLAAAYALADRVLGTGAALFLPWFLYHYYYAMNVTLAQKSAVLIASGVLLLAGFALLGSRGRQKGEAST